MDNNPDGWGLMALVNGKVVVHKGGIPQEKNKKGKVTPEVVADFMSVYKYYKDLEVALHFRYATHGQVDEANTHPYMVAEDVYMMHNGVLSEFTKEQDQTKSDTWHYANTISEMVGYGWLRDPKFLRLINIAAGFNRILFLDKEGFLMPRPSLWNKEGGIMYSNDYGIDQLKPVTQYYGQGGWSPNSRSSVGFVGDTSVPDENGGAIFLPDGSKLVRSYVMGDKKSCNHQPGVTCPDCKNKGNKNDSPKDTLVVVKDVETKNQNITGVNDKGGTKSVDEIIEETRFNVPKTLKEWQELSQVEIEDLLCYEPEMVADEIFSLLQGV